MAKSRDNGDVKTGQRLGDLELPPSADDPGLRGVHDPAPSWGVHHLGAAGGGSVDANDGQFAEAYPTIHEFVTRTRWGKSVRKSGTILLFTDEGRFKCCLNDRETGLTAFLSFESILEGLEALEKGLKLGDLDWRIPKWKKK